MRGNDGAYYGIVNVAGQEEQSTGNCAWRSENPADPSSYRGWKSSALSSSTASTLSSSEPHDRDPGDGDFAMTWVDPYTTDITDVKLHVCDPVPALQIPSLRSSPAAYHMSPRAVRGVPTDGSWPKFAMLADQGVHSKVRDARGELQRMCGFGDTNNNNRISRCCVQYGLRSFSVGCLVDVRSHHLWFT